MAYTIDIDNGLGFAYADGDGSDWHETVRRLASQVGIVYGGPRVVCATTDDHATPYGTHQIQFEGGWYDPLAEDHGYPGQVHQVVVTPA